MGARGRGRRSARCGGKMAAAADLPSTAGPMPPSHGTAHRRKRPPSLRTGARFVDQVHGGPVRSTTGIFLFSPPRAGLKTTQSWRKFTRKPLIFLGAKAQRAGNQRESFVESWPSLRKIRSVVPSDCVSVTHEGWHGNRLASAPQSLSTRGASNPQSESISARRYSRACRRIGSRQAQCPLHQGASEVHSGEWQALSTGWRSAGNRDRTRSGRAGLTDPCPARTTAGIRRGGRPRSAPCRRAPLNGALAGPVRRAMASGGWLVHEDRLTTWIQNVNPR
ncbi:hypothetical protein C8J30_101116 [Rhodobacter viridis]|uniref:Uncharacterized protein n=1 Tax=Rhodobacter viridis TaxID=1054202 RepID=A0A318UGP2_9RHOB|nr:hypothetical protein C8J30_101116 [Rhodobacter viridis]